MSHSHVVLWPRDTGTGFNGPPVIYERSRYFLQLGGPRLELGFIVSG